MRTSLEVDKIFAAISKFQGMITSPPKNRTVEVHHKPEKGGGKHSFQYAELATILEHTRKEFAECALLWTSSVGTVDGGFNLFSRLGHSSGQWIETDYPLPDVADPKIFGGEITYGRRYSFTMLTGIASDQDADDMPGVKNPLPARKAATSTSAPFASPLKPAPVLPKSTTSAKPVSPVTPNMSAEPEWKATQADVDELKAAAKDNEWPFDSVTEYMQKAFQKDRVGLLTRSEFTALVGIIKTMKYMVAMQDLIHQEKPADWEKELAAAPRIGVK